MKLLTRSIQVHSCRAGNQKAIIIARVAMNQAVRLNVLNRPPVNAIKAIKENTRETMNAMVDRKNVASGEITMKFSLQAGNTHLFRERSRTRLNPAKM